MKIIEDFLNDEPELLVNNYEDEYLEPSDLEYPVEEYEDEDEFELEDPMIIPQDDYDVVLEKGDRIKVFSKDLKEAVLERPEDLVDLIDFSYMTKLFTNLGFPVKNIKAWHQRGFIMASAGVFVGKDAGFLRYITRKVELKNFNSGLSENKEGHTTLWLSWSLHYETLDGGSNGISFMDSWYDFVTNTWVYRMRGR